MLTDTSLVMGPYAAVFATLETRGRTDAVARRIGDAIALGLFPDGSPLPSESDLAERLGVAIATVREALSVLRDEDLIVTRRGRGGGSFVRTPVDGGRRALLARLRRIGLGELRDLADHYAAISAMTAQLAAERADGDDIARLRSLSAACSKAPTEEVRRQGEGSFHLELAASGQSARLTREELALQSEIGLILWLSQTDSAATAAAAQRHADIVRFVSKGDGANAREAAQSHVRDMFSTVRELHRQARMEVRP